MKADSNKATLNTILNAKRLEVFPLKPTRIESCVLSLFLLNTDLIVIVKIRMRMK